jgi:hypothetical protein
MGKIGDLFVRLGLKSDGFKKGMTDAKKETQSFGSKLGQMKAGALAVWAAIGTAVVQFGRDFISSTNKMGDAWAKTMGGMKSVWQTFKSSLANWDWKNFGKKISEAFEAGKEKEAAYDAQFELVNSVRLQRQAIQQELNELYATMRDTSQSSEARRAAKERYMALLQPIADAEIEVYGNMLDAAINEWTAGTGLNRSREEIVEFFTKIGTDAEAMKAKYADIFNVYESQKGDKQNLGIFDIISQYQEAANQMSNAEREMARVTNSINAEIRRAFDNLVNDIETAAGEDLELDLKLDVDLEEIDWSALEEELAANIHNLQSTLSAEYAEIDSLNKMLAQSLTDSFSSGLQALTDFLMGVDGANTEQIMAAFIQPIANMMKGMGEMFMAEGIAELALVNAPPAGKIAAGAALIAVSSALASGLSKMQGAIGGTSASTSASASSATGTSMQTYEQEITVNVVGEISGDKIILAGQKTLNKWSR